MSDNKTIRIKESKSYWFSSLEEYQIARFEYKTIWEAVDQRSRDIWPMGGFLIGTALLSMAYTAVNLRLMGFYAILVLAVISIIISAAWLIVFYRVSKLNDECLGYLRRMEATPRKYVGVAQTLMHRWAEDLPVSRHAGRRAFYFVVGALIVAWIALLCIKLFCLS